MALTPDQKRRIQNHIPTVQKTCQVFLDVMDTEPDKETKKLAYLIDLIDAMEKDLSNTKDILNE